MARSREEAAGEVPAWATRLDQAIRDVDRTRMDRLDLLRSDIGSVWDTLVTTDSRVGRLHFFSEPPKPAGPDAQFPDNARSDPHFNGMVGYHGAERLWAPGISGRVLTVQVYVGASVEPITDGVATLYKNGNRRVRAPLWSPYPMFHDVVFQDGDRAFIDVQFTDPGEVARSKLHEAVAPCWSCNGRGWLRGSMIGVIQEAEHDVGVTICGRCKGVGFFIKATDDEQAFPFDPAEYARHFPTGTLIRCVATVESIGLIDRQ